MRDGVVRELGDDMGRVMERKPPVRQLGGGELPGGASAVRGGGEGGGEGDFLIHVTQRGDPCVT